MSELPREWLTIVAAKLEEARAYLREAEADPVRYSRRGAADSYHAQLRAAYEAGELVFAHRVGPDPAARAAIGNLSHAMQIADARHAARREAGE